MSLIKQNSINKMIDLKIPTESLRELPQDDRDFALGAIFPQINIEDVPLTDFVVAIPKVIKNQGNTDLCSGYAVTAVSEDQEGVELLPEYQFYKTKKISGDMESWGADLRDACKSVVRYGSLPVQGHENIKGISRSRVVSDETWEDSMDGVANFYKKETYFSITGKYDTFDNIRLALWQHRNNKNSVVTGAKWRSEWLGAKDGILPEQYGNNGFGHAFKIFGQKNIGGNLYLVAQLSQGEDVGDKGIFYLPRSLVNREIGKYGIYMLTDISKEDAKFYTSTWVTKNSPWWEVLIARIIHFIKIN